MEFTALLSFFFAFSRLSFRVQPTGYCSELYSTISSLFTCRTLLVSEKRAEKVVNGCGIDPIRVYKSLLRGSCGQAVVR